ncbi:E3 ubiquitin-protein ligase TRIM11-like isoform X2 [Paroedura picta]|uniref:E3 ubiquitin-protein ligase TRIM11-like isoform X2 n=1 Tax=Paroedura picta TaxID=143630 RepID=UPI00405669C5
MLWRADSLAFHLTEAPLLSRLHFPISKNVKTGDVIPSSCSSQTIPGNLCKQELLLLRTATLSFGVRAMDFSNMTCQEEATCLICMEYYTDPILLDCGHSFCRICINQFWMEFSANTACPLCGKVVLTTNCQPNRALANMAEFLKQFRSQEEEESGGNLCRKHPKPSELFFCKDDKVSLCLACERSEEHINHHIVPLKEAAKEYKDCLQSCIEALRNEKREILTHKINAIRESEEFMQSLVTEQQKTLTELKRLQRFLANQEGFLLAHMQAVARGMASEKDAHSCRLNAELFIRQNAIEQLEKKCQQPDNKLLQDAVQTLEKCGQMRKFKPPEIVPLQLRWRTWLLCELNVLLEGAATHFKDTLQLGYQSQEVNVTLDPETAHPQVVLSSDGKRVKWTKKEQDVPLTVKRFDQHFCVMGHQQFRAGRYFWDVTVGGEEDWAVGVATSSVDRMGISPLSPEMGFFAIKKISEWYVPPRDQEQKKEKRKIRISLNCSGGQVVFYDAERARKLYSFNHASIQKETLQPFFWLKGDVQLSLSTS